MGKKKISLAAALRRCVLDSKKTMYRICKDAKIPQPSMSRFMSGTSNLSFENLEKLLNDLDFSITPPTKPAARKGRSKRARATSKK